MSQRARRPDASVLAAELPITRQTVVQHLAVLAQADLVTRGRRGRERWFAVRTEQIIETARRLDGLATEFESRYQPTSVARESNNSAPTLGTAAARLTSGHLRLSTMPGTIQLAQRGAL